MDKTKDFVFTKAEIKKFKSKEAKMTQAQKRAANKGLVEANTAANRIKKRG